MSYYSWSGIKVPFWGAWGGSKGYNVCVSRTKNAECGVDAIGTKGNDSITGTWFNDKLFGGDGNDTLKGLAGNDYLDGGKGADTMIGGWGDDVYVVDDECDVVSECLWQGNDTVISYIDYTLGNHVENLVAAGDKALTLNGNNLDNIISGNAADNVINGGGGNDKLYGGDGCDTLNGGEGCDVLYGEHGDDKLSGGAGADKLYGGEGNDWLDGGSGNDVLYGGAGDDILIGGGGRDALYGEDGDDNLYGSNDADCLDGGNGCDVLDGGYGNDWLNGGAGGDTYIYGKNYGHDTIVDCGDPCDTDRIEFKSDICLTDLCFTASHGNLIISAGKGDSITVKNWFHGEQNQIEMLSFNSNDISVSNEQINAAFNHSSYGASVSGASLAAMVQEQAAQTAAVI